MQYNIKAEEGAIEGYRRAIQKTNRPNLKQLFNRIILDEQTHIKIFTEILNDAKKYNY